MDSRASEDGYVIRRRRECLHCKRRYTTYERLEELGIKVVKKDGVREPFNREKIRAGLAKACWKRPISDEQIEGIVAHVESYMYANCESEIESSKVGELVMERLAERRSGRLRPLRQRLSPASRTSATSSMSCSRCSNDSPPRK